MRNWEWCEEELVGVVRGSASGEGGGVGRCGEVWGGVGRCGEGWERGAISRS